MADQREEGQLHPDLLWQDEIGLTVGTARALMGALDVENRRLRGVLAQIAALPQSLNSGDMNFARMLAADALRTEERP